MNKYVTFQQGYDAGYDDGLYGNVTLIAGVTNEWQNGYYQGRMEGIRKKENKKMPDLLEEFKHRLAEDDESAHTLSR